MYDDVRVGDKASSVFLHFEHRNCVSHSSLIIWMKNTLASIPYCNCIVADNIPLYIGRTVILVWVGGWFRLVRFFNLILQHVQAPLTIINTRFMKYPEILRFMKTKWSWLIWPGLTDQEYNMMSQCNDHAILLTNLTLTALKDFYINQEAKGFFKFEITINILVSFFCFI